MTDTYRQRVVRADGRAVSIVQRLTCPALVVDAETGPHPLGRSKLADTLRATYVRLDGLDAAQAIRLALERLGPTEARA